MLKRDAIFGIQEGDVKSSLLIRRKDAQKVQGIAVNPLNFLERSQSVAKTLAHGGRDASSPNPCRFRQLIGTPDCRVPFAFAGPPQPNTVLLPF